MGQVDDQPQGVVFAAGIISGGETLILAGAELSGMPLFPGELKSDGLRSGTAGAGESILTAGLTGISAGMCRNAGVSASFRRRGASASVFSDISSVSSPEKSDFINAKPKPIITKAGKGDPVPGNF